MTPCQGCRGQEQQVTDLGLSLRAAGERVSQGNKKVDWAPLKASVSDGSASLGGDAFSWAITPTMILFCPHHLFSALLG